MGSNELFEVSRTIWVAARIVSVQNPYSLLNRTAEIGLAEILYREKVALLPYSPLEFGVLTGKYLNGQLPKGSRLALFPQYSRYLTENGVKATAKYIALAQNRNIHPVHLALSYVNSRPFVGSTIIGATNIEQLKIAIDTVNYPLDKDILTEVENIHNQCHNPCP